MSDPIEAPAESKPPALARAPLLALTGAWLASPVLAIAFLIYDHETAGIIALWTFVALTGMLAIGPALVVLWYRQQHRDEPLPRGLRRSGIGSAVAAVIVGGIVWFVGRFTAESALTVSGILFALAVVPVLALLVAAPRRTDALGAVRVAGTHVLVVVIFALGAAIALPKVGCACGGKGPAYRAAMKSDLRNLVYAEEAFFTDSGRYTSRIDALKMRMTSGMNAPTIVLQGTSGWTATVTHSNLPGETCGIAVGAKNPVDASREEGAPACTTTR